MSFLQSVALHRLGTRKAAQTRRARIQIHNYALEVKFISGLYFCASDSHDFRRRLNSVSDTWIDLWLVIPDIQLTTWLVSQLVLA